MCLLLRVSRKRVEGFPPEFQDRLAPMWWPCDSALRLMHAEEPRSFFWQSDLFSDFLGTRYLCLGDMNYIVVSASLACWSHHQNFVFSGFAHRVSWSFCSLALSREGGSSCPASVCLCEVGVQRLCLSNLRSPLALCGSSLLTVTLRSRVFLQIHRDIRECCLPLLAFTCSEE